ncbi:hypothetical protein [Hymenobacter cellulosilyticus]|uniref:Uncharacterized protein n=1 Tax=Hymenobacter cellulosilyticus TaxID=2932248 RepID=A0A8T9Q3H7_9BACT|nr:hypothetical protein [Hymenobacter cellulosilyticus]UOQ71522.1 hypothetical protein MUN79_23360 [Hymenobacter cellulosilyticus]
MASRSYGQSVVGTWQVGTKVVSNGPQASDVFKADKTFEYQVNTDDGLQRIRAIGGTYTTGRGYIELRVAYTTEIVGGTLERSHINVSNDSWTLEGGKLEKRKLAKPVTEVLEIKFLSTEVLTIDENKFYRIR